MPRHLAAIALAAVLLPTAASCGSANALPQDVGATQKAAPDSIALQYVSDVFSTDPASALAVILPVDRETYQVLESDLEGRSGTTRDLAVGSTTISGQSALVVLTGSICVSESSPSQGKASAKPSPSPSAACETNSSGTSTNPVFEVHLALDNGNWLVYYPLPSSGGSAGAGASSAASATARP